MGNVNLVIVSCLFFIMTRAFSESPQISNGSYNAVEYMEIRKELLTKDLQPNASRLPILNVHEQNLDNYLRSSSLNFQHHFLESNTHPSNQNFALSKSAIENSVLFKILTKMPKGGLLHLHTCSAGDANWVIQYALRENVYVYMKDSGPFAKGTLKLFLKDHPLEGFQRMQDVVAKDHSFLAQMYEWITMDAKDSASANPWNKFVTCFERVDDLMNYKPFFVEYYKHAFERIAQDQIQIVEIRTSLDSLYDKEGNAIQDDEVVTTYRSIVKQVQEKYPFFTLKLIISGMRSINLTDQRTTLERAYRLKANNPDMIVGYDLEGYETSGHALIYYLRNLLTEASSLEKKYQTKLPYFFHAGENGWGSDKNLYDAVLLHSKRIGHAINLFYFPNLLQEIIKKDICIEVCPISNQMLGYVKDLRMHPAISYMKQGVACVIGSDDPQIFHTHGLSYDFWEAIMAWNLNLAEVKQLCMNSILYSSLDEKEKEKALLTWLEMWDEFIHQAIADLHLS